MIPGAPCALGLVLEGEAARRFDEYLANPTCTPKGEAIIKAAVDHHRACRKIAWCMACGHQYPDANPAMQTSVCRTCGKPAVVWGSPDAYTYYIEVIHHAEQPSIKPL